MPEEPIRVAMIMGKMVGGGVEAVVMNYYRSIDKNKIQFDFIVDSDSTRIPKEEILKLGGKIFIVSPYQKTFKYTKDLKKVFRENDYQIVHSHINTLSVIPLFVAKKCSIPIRIAHNHSTAGNDQVVKNLFKYTLKLFSKIYPTHYMAPIYSTGEWLFGKKIAKNELYILPNAFDIQKFSFETKKRDKIRKNIGINKNDYLLGNVGRLVHSKNQMYLLDILKEISKIEPNTKLIIIGEGTLKNTFEDKIEKENLNKQVIFVPNVKNIEDYYMAMDLFLFPSYYEGLGLAAVEAQATGLPVIANENLPMEINVTNKFFKKSLDDKNEWINKILEIINSPLIRERSNKLKLEELGYDINKEAKILEDFYLKELDKHY